MVFILFFVNSYGPRVGNSNVKYNIKISLKEIAVIPRVGPDLPRSADYISKPFTLPHPAALFCFHLLSSLSFSLWLGPQNLQVTRTFEKAWL